MVVTHLLDNRLTNGVEVVSLTHVPLFTSQEDLWYSFLLDSELTKESYCDWIEKSSDLIGNRNCDLPACSIVPQPTTLPLWSMNKLYNFPANYICTCNLHLSRLGCPGFRLLLWFPFSFPHPCISRFLWGFYGPVGIWNVWYGWYGWLLNWGEFGTKPSPFNVAAVLTFAWMSWWTPRHTSG
jgi:hypothetical protein